MSVLHTLISSAYSIKATDIGLDSGAHSIGDVFRIAIKVILVLLGFLSTIFVIVGALQMVASAGDPQRFRMARETLIYAAVGIAISVSAYAIVVFITNGLK